MSKISDIEPYPRRLVANAIMASRFNLPYTFYFFLPLYLGTDFICHNFKLSILTSRKKLRAWDSDPIVREMSAFTKVIA